MIIDQKLGLIFIHIPKTGGTSLHQWFGSQNRDLVIVLWGKTQDGVDQAHLTLSQALDHIPSFPINYFKIAFVRHPYDRIYSAFLQPYRQMYPNLTFDDFLERFVKRVDEANLDLELVHLWPMYCFITINGSNSVDFVGRMETWDEDIEFIKNSFGLQGRPGHQNQSRGNKALGAIRRHDLGSPKYYHKYNREQLEIINKIYKKDFEWFSYNASISISPSP